jgi:phosphatidylglycerophosphatase A
LKKSFTPKPIQNSVRRFLILGSATGLGLGFAPKAPGTFGSLLGIPLGLSFYFFLSLPLALTAVFLFFLFSVFVAQKAGDHWGQRDSGKIVIDEVVGQALTLVLVGHGTDLPQSFSVFKTPDFMLVTIAFLFFRLFDIIKPGSARKLDRMDSGWGVVGDDMVAGLYAAAATVIVERVIF